MIQFQITGMARTRKDARDKVGHLRPALTLHLLKLILTGASTQDTRGWLREVANFMLDAYDLSGIKGGGRLSKEDFDDLLFDYDRDTIHAYLHNKLDEYLPSFVKSEADYQCVALLAQEDLELVKPVLSYFLCNPKKERISALIDEKLFSASRTYQYLSAA
jgi:hypothetical protein